MTATPAERYSALAWSGSRQLKSGDAIKLTHAPGTAGTDDRPGPGVIVARMK